MNPYHTILVGFALDDRDRTSFRHAAILAKATNAETLIAAHVYRTTRAALPSEAMDALKTDFEEQLRAAVEGERSHLPENVKVETLVREGSPAAELARLAAQTSADLLVLGRQGGASADLLSEMALQLVRKAPCSVFLVPPQAETRYRRILVPLDFSDHSLMALEAAVALARSQPSAALTLQHTYDVPLGWHKSGHSHAEFAARIKKNAEERWAKLVTEVDLGGVDVTIRFDLGDNIPQTILQVSDEMNADLIVMGSHGRTWPAEVLLGHAADIVCSRTTRPILCVKKKGEVVNLLKALLQMFEFQRS